MAEPLRVLIVEDNEDEALLVLRELRRGGLDVDAQRVETAAAMKAALEEGSWDLVISDYALPSFSAPAALAMLKEAGIDVPFLIVSGTIGEETAVAAMKAGAHDYLMKENLARLVPAIERELREAASRRQRRQAEQALLESEEQLLQAQKLEAVGRLAGGVAHDFNNILQVMLGVLEMLRVGQHGNPDVTAAVAELSHLVGRAAALTRQLLLFARRGVTRPENLDLNDVIESAVAMLGRLIRANVRVVVERADQRLPIRGDAGQLEQVLLNLVVNALDAMPEGGELMLKTGRSDGWAWFEVADTGSGIPENLREAIFEPFFTTKGAESGTGLGLSVVHGIVRQHGGTIALASRPGGGTTFRVELPTSDSGRFEPVAQGDPVGGAVGGERVLVVEDDPAVKEALGSLLAWLGYRVTLVEDEEELSRLADEGPFDLLITDFMLPSASGLQISEMLRQRWPALRVIVMSGYAESEVLRQEVGEGTVRFLQKPVDLTTLAREVRAALDEP